MHYYDAKSACILALQNIDAFLMMQIARIFLDVAP